jgi:23S rRNA pseudouridine1911/1915/1917 synthase
LSVRTDPASSTGETFTLTATAEQAGQRVDKMLADAIGGVSRSRVKALIAAGAASRDGRPLRDAADTVRAGSFYSVCIPAAVPAQPQPEAIPLAILYEDAALLVIDKPAGLVVHPAPGNAAGTLVNAVLAHAGEELTGIGGEQRPGIVHRLDKDTSGVMVVAKTDRAHQALSAAFAARDLDRDYLALAWGLPVPAAGEIAGAIGRHPTDRKRMAVVARGGKAALTRYATERAWGGSCALLRCRLATGRTHQIRVHLAALGHPLIGDPVYLRRIPAAAQLVPEKGGLPGPVRDALLAFPRQALHAATLGFRHPVSGAALRFSAPPPADFLRLLALLDGNAE